MHVEREYRIINAYEVDHTITGDTLQGVRNSITRLYDVVNDVDNSVGPHSADKIIVIDGNVSGPGRLTQGPMLTSPHSIPLDINSWRRT